MKQIIVFILSFTFIPAAFSQSQNSTRAKVICSYSNAHPKGANQTMDLNAQISVLNGRILSVSAPAVATNGNYSNDFTVCVTVTYEAPVVKTTIESEK